jgi:hypothetical protein
LRVIDRGVNNKGVSTTRVGGTLKLRSIFSGLGQGRDSLKLGIKAVITMGKHRIDIHALQQRETHHQQTIACLRNDAFVAMARQFTGAPARGGGLQGGACGVQRGGGLQLGLAADLAVPEADWEGPPPPLMASVALVRCLGFRG